jgi:adenine phosphoribosyltransferase
VTTVAEVEYLKSLVLDVPDFPKKGIVFKDITAVLKDAHGFASAVGLLAAHFRDAGVSSVVCVEARGFVLGSAVAYALGCGFVPIRKKGKLPRRMRSAAYELEYGRDFLEIHEDALAPGERVAIIDDVLATGGTISAALELVRGLGADVAGLGFLIELGFLKGRDRLRGVPVHSLVRY